MEKTPCSSASIIKPAGATRAFNDFTLTTIINIVNWELSQLGPLFRLRAGKDIGPAQLTEMRVSQMIDMMKTTAPKLWYLLVQSLSSAKQQKSRLDSESKRGRLLN